MRIIPNFRLWKYLLSCVLSVAISPVYAQSAQEGVSGVHFSYNLTGGNPVSPAAVPVLPVRPDEVIYQTFDVPVVVIHAKYPYPAPRVALHQAFRTVRLPQWPEMYSNLAEYELPFKTSSLYILALRGARASAMVGQDGSYAITLKGASMEVDLTSTGACGMCAVEAAGEYFPRVRSYVKSVEGAWHGVSMENLPVTQLLWNSKTDLFAYKETRNQVLAGFSYYAPMTAQSSATFISEVVRGDRSHVNALAPWLFHFTLKQIPGSGVDSPPSGLALYHGSMQMVQQIREAHVNLNAKYWPFLGTKDEKFESASIQGNVLVLKYSDVTMMDSPVPFPKQMGLPIVLQNGIAASWTPRGRGGEINTNFNGVYMRLVSSRLSPHQLMDVAASLDPLDG